MENGNIGTGTAGVLALLADTARAGRGYGWGGGEGGMYGGPFANMSSVMHGIQNVGQNVEDQADCTRNLFGQAFSSIQGAFENQTRSAQVAALTKQITDGEFRTLDRFRDQDREMAANAREAAKCCCDLKLQMCQDKSEILAAIAAQGAKTTERELDKANAEIIFLRSQQGHHHHRP